MKKKNGFTLIELLAVFGIMSMILIIAVISVRSITKSKKEESLKTVKDEVASAALDYLNSHEYLLNNFDSESTLSVDIPLGLLVNEDYLNAVTDPTTGKKMDECLIVNIEKTGNKINTTLSDTPTSNCDVNSVAIVDLVKGPSTKATEQCLDISGQSLSKKKTNGYCYTHKVNLSNDINASEIDKITSVKYCISIENNSGGFAECEPNIPLTINDNISIVDETPNNKKKKIYLIMYNNLGGPSSQDFTYGIDHTSPTVAEGSNTPDNILFLRNTITQNSKAVLTSVTPINYQLNTIDTQSGITYIKVGNTENTYNASTKAIKSNGETTLNEDITLNGDKKELPFVVKDAVGNTLSNKKTYYLYEECMQKTDSTPTVSRGECDCTTKKRKITTKTKEIDNVTKRVCNVRTSIQEEACTPTGCELNCPTYTVSPSSPNGNDNYYKSNISISIKPDNTVDHWAWQTKDKSGENDYHTWSSNNKGNETKKITAEGTYAARVVVYNSAGNSRDCSVGTYKLDKTAPDCPTISSSPNKPNGNNNYYTSEVVLTIKPSSDTNHWDWATDDGNSWHTYSTNVKGKQQKKLISGGTRQGRIIVYDKVGNARTCYTDKYKIDKTAPDCPSIKTSGTKGDNGWYTSKINVTVSQPKDIDHWKWYTRYNGEYTYYSTNTKADTKTLGDGTNRRGKVTVYDKAGNSTNCFTNFFDVDTVKPSMSITYGPKIEYCGGSKSVRTKYTAKDETSGLDVVKDYYGYDTSVPGAGSEYWRNRSGNFTSGVKSYSHDHNWGPNCYTKGNPGNHKYRLKYYLKDRAGNVNSGYSSATSSSY